MYETLLFELVLSVTLGAVVGICLTYALAVLEQAIYIRLLDRFQGLIWLVILILFLSAWIYQIITTVQFKTTFILLVLGAAFMVRKMINRDELVNHILLLLRKYCYRLKMRKNALKKYLAQFTYARDMCVWLDNGWRLPDGELLYGDYAMFRADIQKFLDKCSRADFPEWQAEIFRKSGFKLPQV